MCNNSKLGRQHVIPEPEGCRYNMATGNRKQSEVSWYRRRARRSKTETLIFIPLDSGKTIETLSNAMEHNVTREN